MNEKFQPPAEGIMLNCETKDSKFYTAFCECGNPDDSIEIQVEVDEYGEIIVYFHVKSKTHFWEKLYSWQTHKIDNEFLFLIVNSFQSLLNGLYRRIKFTWDIWVLGYAQYQTTTILNKQRAINFAETLKTAIKDLEKK